MENLYIRNGFECHQDICISIYCSVKDNIYKDIFIICNLSIMYNGLIYEYILSINILQLLCFVDYIYNCNQCKRRHCLNVKSLDIQITFVRSLYTYKYTFSLQH